MFKRMALILLAVSTIALGAPAPANATVFTGSCALNLTFSFHTRVRPASSLQTAVGYDVTATSARDLDPLAAGSQPCVVDTDALNPFRTTDAAGSGNSLAWTCEFASGTGSWNQSWTPDPAPLFGSHTISGPWGDWTLIVNSPSLNFAGVAHLTVDPADATSLAQCETGGISSLRMTGVMYFQDP